ncbi:MAG: hypothetical protein H8E18_17160 [FCB group bacterium]|nr:hypothetical protein [FCB group bacterium]
MKKLILLLIVPLFAQFQDISTRLYEIDFELPESSGISTEDTLFINEIIGVEQEWYQISPVSLRILDGGQDYGFISVYGGEYGGYWFFHYNNDTNTFRIELDSSPNSDGLRLIHGDNPYMVVNGPGPYSTGVLTVLITSNFDDSWQSGYDADWNGDGEINIIDIVAIVDYILFGEG